MVNLFKAIGKNARTLAVFAIVCTLVVGAVNALTKDTIAKREQQQLMQQLNDVVELNLHDNLLYQDCIQLAQTPALKEIINDYADTPLTIDLIYRARKNNNPIAAAITTKAPDGYNGNIDLIIGINFDGTVTGVRTLKHNETPGLGDKIEIRKSNWITSFNGKKLTEDNDKSWAVLKDGGSFDQFTGATITPRAVIKAVKKTTKFFNQHKQALFSAASNCGADL